MVIGASSVGARAMTSSSSPGISLKQEGISYLAGSELPAVIINIVSGGPGLGNLFRPSLITFSPHAVAVMVITGRLHCSGLCTGNGGHDCSSL